MVFPAFTEILQGKKVLHCLNGHSWQDSITLAVALDWLRKYDGTANTLVLKTGKDSDITVIDDDDRDGPNPFLWPYIPNCTPTARTGNNGLHFFFQYDADIPTASYKTVSIDLRNDGGLIFLPPSCIEGRQYRWIRPLNRDTLRPMPEPLKAFCLSLRTPQPWTKRQPGTKSYEQLSQKQKYFLNGYLNRCKQARKGVHDRSACDYALCSWAVKIDLSSESLWSLVHNIGKFAEPGHGQKYFDMTYKNALRTT